MTGITMRTRVSVRASAQAAPRARGSTRVVPALVSLVKQSVCATALSLALATSPQQAVAAECPEFTTVSAGEAKGLKVRLPASLPACAPRKSRRVPR
jgi:hypothetical protein